MIARYQLTGSMLRTTIPWFSRPAISSIRPFAHVAASPSSSTAQNQIDHSILLKYDTFQKAFPSDLASYSLQTGKKTPGGNLKSFDKIFWFNQYRVLLNQPTVYFIQNNNIPLAHIKMMKKELKKHGLGIIRLRNKIFRAAVNAHAPLLAQTQSESDSLFYRRDFRKLATLPVGPTLMVFSQNSGADAVNQIKEFAGLFKKLDRSQAILIGARVGNMILTPDSFQKAALLPSHQQLYGELLGLLSHPASSIVSTLSATPQSLVMNLNQYQNQLSGSKEEPLIS